MLDTAQFILFGLLTIVLLWRALKSLLHNVKTLHPKLDALLMVGDPNVSVHGIAAFVGSYLIMHEMWIAVSWIYALLFIVPYVWHKTSGTKPAYADY